MSCTKLLSIFVLVTMLVAVVFSASGCFGQPSSTTSVTKNPEAIKPKPVVEGVIAATSGTLDKYYAILEITVKNNGADGTIIVVGSITQGAETIENELPVYITQNTRQVIRLVFPLTWKGGDWTPNVRTEVP